jgi:hypothetical protein
MLLCRTNDDDDCAGMIIAVLVVVVTVNPITIDIIGDDRSTEMITIFETIISDGNVMMH